MGCTVIKVARGDQFVLPLTVQAEGFDWTDVLIKCQLRESDENDDFVTQISSTGGSSGTSVVSSIETVGVYTVVLTVEGTATVDWPDGLIGDIELSRSSPAFGPITSPQFSIEVRTPSTR